MIEIGKSERWCPTCEHSDKLDVINNNSCFNYASNESFEIIVIHLPVPGR